MRLPDSTKMRVLLAHLRHCRVSMRHHVAQSTLAYRDRFVGACVLCGGCDCTIADARHVIDILVLLNVIDTIPVYCHSGDDFVKPVAMKVPVSAGRASAAQAPARVQSKRTCGHSVLPSVCTVSHGCVCVCVAAFPAPVAAPKGAKRTADGVPVIRGNLAPGALSGQELDPSLMYGASARCVCCVCVTVCVYV